MSLTASPGVEEVDGVKVSAAGKAISPYSPSIRRRRTQARHADIKAAHPRTFSIDSAGKLLVAGSLAPTAIRRDGKVVIIPAGLTMFKIGPDGKLDFVRKYDLDVGKLTQWWSGMISLA